jgi:hypothetical protein
VRPDPFPAARRYYGRRDPWLRPRSPRRGCQHPRDIWRGELGYLAAISPTVNRLVLELTDRQAAALAAAISDTTAVAPEVARLQGVTLAAVFHFFISEAGQRTRDGQSQAEIADELCPMVENSSTNSTAG